jgi:hypothetical protein
VINGWGNAVTLTQGDDNVIAAASSASTRPGRWCGRTAANNLIGGTAAADRYVIAASASTGIAVQTGPNRIEGNFIGTDASGTRAIANQTGISIGNGAAGNTVGGAAAGARNLLSGNTSVEILLTANANNTLVRRVNATATYGHEGPVSRICVQVSGPPGTSGTVTVLPGVGSAPITTDANGMASAAFRITAFGPYGIQVSLGSMTAFTTVNVTAAPGTCPTSCAFLTGQLGTECGGTCPGGGPSCLYDPAVDDCVCVGSERDCSQRTGACTLGLCPRPEDLCLTRESGCVCEPD